MPRPAGGETAPIAPVGLSFPLRGNSDDVGSAETARVRASGAGRTARDAVARFIEHDGTSHARALAYQSAFVLMSGFIGLIGLASVLNWAQLRATVEAQAERLAPGPGAALLQEAAQHGASGAGTAALVGIVAALAGGTLAMAQLERSANRLSDIDRDRPALSRYVLSFVLAISAGAPLVIGGLIVGSGKSIAHGAGLEGAAATAWSIARWPLGAAIAGAGIFVLYRVLVPGRPSTRDLVVGTGVALALWVTFTALLGLYLSLGSQSSHTYGPLLAVIALLLWSALTSLALHLGIALIAERTQASGDRTVRLPDSATTGRSPASRP
jgi:uncharacterized BrkB/YihY/UPF0761 family membrane protein